jgi:predicted nucleic acid-binding protein
VILYLDASALVKRYVTEKGSGELILLTTAAEAIATALVSRAEVAAAFARAVRLGVLDEVSGRRVQRRFSREWPDLVRVPVTEGVASRAGTLAWDYGLRGYDAVQLAAALTWQDAIGQEVVVATFDRQLWESVPRAGLQVWPDRLTN